MAATDATGRKVLVIDDHELVARMLTEALRARGYDARHCAAPTDEAVRDVIETFSPAVALLDLELGGGRSGVRLIPPLRDVGARVIMFTGTTNRIRLAECVEAGAAGVLTKKGSVDEVVRAVDEVHSGGALLSEAQRTTLLSDLHAAREGRTAQLAVFEALTPKEREILSALIQGKQAQTIADETFTSIKTVRGHIEKVLQKLGVTSQLAAVAKANEVGWTDLQS